MSRSLSRIRNLISEIEEIHRQGQQGSPAAEKASISELESPILQIVRPAPVPNEIASNLVASSAAPSASPLLTAVPAPDASTDEAEDPFLELASVVHLDEKRAAKNEPVQDAKIFMKLAGAVSVSLQVENTGETLEVKQVGNFIEIRFADGKVFHLPLKAVA